MLDRAVSEKERILREHELGWVDEAIQQELDRINFAPDRDI